MLPGSVALTGMSSPFLKVERESYDLFITFLLGTWVRLAILDERPPTLLASTKASNRLAQLSCGLTTPLIPDS